MQKIFFIINRMVTFVYQINLPIFVIKMYTDFFHSFILSFMTHYPHEKSSLKYYKILILLFKNLDSVKLLRNPFTPFTDLSY